MVRYYFRPNLTLPDGWLADDSFAELSIAPALNSRLVPPHARAALEARGLDIDNLTPLTKEEMMARLD